MNRTGLLIALVIAVATGLVFSLAPQLDIAISRLVFDSKIGAFYLAVLVFYQGHGWVEQVRDAAMWVVGLLALAPAAAVIIKLVRPNRPLLVSGRAGLLLLGTLALGPGLLTNVVLKEHWARPRPIDLRDFGGTDDFVPWWDPRGSCEKNCSFVAGEGSGAFWTLAPAALAPPAMRPIAYAGALAFGAAVGAMRIAAGAHFFTDVVFGGVFTFLIIWIAHGVLYRWAMLPRFDAAIERTLERIALPLHLMFGRLAQRGSGSRP